MADSGMLLNFDLGDAPLKSQVKYTGGRWRDRSQAKRNAKNNGQGPSSGSNTTPLPKHRQDTSTSNDAEPPSKRQRTTGDVRPQKSLSYMTGKLPPGSISTGFKPNGGGGGVTSRLFTSNPTAKTVFEDPQEEAEPAKPSNAPLSDEASNFHAIGLSRRIAQHLSTKLEMKAPTSIQKNTIPQLVKEDSDAFLQAETGSGKTLAYLLPIVQRLISLSQNEDGTNTGKQIHRDSGLFAVILAPTRELCKQIANVLEKLLRCAPWLVSTTVIGGESKKSEKARLRKGVNILIATPGRLADHLDNTKVLDVGTVRWLVLDEGDRLMEMGFEEELKSIVGKIRKEPLKAENHAGVRFDELPQRRVTVLCSATMKMNVQKLGEISLEDAIHVTASKSEGDQEANEDNDAVFSAPAQLKQNWYIVPAKLRLVTLMALLKASFARKGSIMKAIVFISCADSVDFHFELLRSSSERHRLADEKTSNTVAEAAYITSPANPSITLLKLHGSLPQPVRTGTLAAFHSEKEPCVLFTTDIASRGLDVPSVDLVIEYDPAFCVDDHTHRIGRTARAGKPGKAALFIQPGCEEGYLDLLKSSAPSTTQSFEPVLQKGFLTPITLPKSVKSNPTASNEEDDEEASSSEPQTLKTERQTPNSRAEALQLHLEQRLLASDKEEKDGGNSKNNKNGKPTKSNGASSSAAPTTKLLDSARQAFRSHIRAYATHVRDERGFFDITQLHLGHTAKSYGLREAPGGIGSGPSARRAIHKGQQQKGNNNNNKSADSESSSRRAAILDNDDDDDNRRGNPVDDEAANRMRMRMKMKAVMDAAGEFNIG